MGAGVTLLVTNAASDTDVPVQTLAYSLPVAPPSAVVHPASGVITWRPPVAAAGLSNLFTVRVVDDGIGSLAATQSFTVVVNPLNRPSTGNPQFTNHLFQLTLNGDYGPDYIVQASTNLTTWTSLATNASPVLPFTWTDLAATNFNQRFYRVLLGP